jgi:hypothetical protein
MTGNHLGGMACPKHSGAIGIDDGKIRFGSHSGYLGRIHGVGIACAGDEGPAQGSPDQQFGQFLGWHSRSGTFEYRAVRCGCRGIHDRESASPQDGKTLTGRT